MNKIILLILCSLSLHAFYDPFGKNNYKNTLEITDEKMKSLSNQVLIGEKKSFTVDEAMTAIFSIEERGEFEEKADFIKRIKHLVNSDGILIINQKIEDTRYNIDNKEMNFKVSRDKRKLINTAEPNNYLKGEGYSYVNQFINFKASCSEDDYLKKNNWKVDNYNYRVSMSVDEAKKLRKNKDNSFYRLIALKITPEDIQKRIAQPLPVTVNGVQQKNVIMSIGAECIGQSLVSTNPKTVYYSYATKVKVLKEEVNSEKTSSKILNDRFNKKEKIIKEKNKVVAVAAKKSEPMKEKNKLTSIAAKKSETMKEKNKVGASIKNKLGEEGVKDIFKMF